MEVAFVVRVRQRLNNGVLERLIRIPREISLPSRFLKLKVEQNRLILEPVEVEK